MDFHAAMETFAEAWVAANTQTPVNAESASPKPGNSQDSLVTKDSNPLTPQKEEKLMKMGMMKPGNSSAAPASATSGKAIPVHCIIEREPQGGDTRSPSVEVDSYAIIPAQTLFREVVHTALVKLGYTSTEAISAKGAIVVKNWKPLTLDMITDRPDANVEEMFADLTNVISLRIRLSRNKEWNDQAVRSAVKELLKEINQTKLSQLCPLSQTMISTIANSRYSAKISEQTCVAFGQWYDEYKQQPKSEEFSEGPPKDSRITFHPMYEIPQMRRWYKSDKSPSEESLKYFLNELNKGPVRQDRPKLTLAKIKIWWKNERSREKKIQHKTAQKMLAELEEETAGLDDDSDFSDMLL